MPELRDVYPVPYIRALHHIVLVGSVVLGALSIFLRTSKVLGLIGISLAVTAMFLGGSTVQINEELTDGPFLGLDWFLINLIVFSVLFIPLERFFPKHSDQPIFRSSWRTDLTYFFFSAFLVQVTTLLTLKPAVMFFHWAVSPGLHSWVSGLPFVLQFIAILFFADLAQYWVHRLFHSVPVLWRFHSVHHSAESMDWLAGSRLHLVDVAVTRGITYIPIYLLGFGEGPLFTYVVFVSIQATFIHSNLRFEYGPLRWLIATPQFHHWHHTADAGVLDKNFAVHLPFLDRMFGTYHLPKSLWPESYGLAGDDNVRGSYLGQFLYPFLPQRKENRTGQ